MADVVPPRYVPKPFEREPDFATASVTFPLEDLLRRASVG